ncbi:unnamed protein product [Brassica oleracea]
MGDDHGQAEDRASHPHLLRTHNDSACIANRLSVIYNAPFSDAPDAEEANTYAGNERGGADDMVVDVLIHHTRSLLLSHSEQPQPNSAVFLDTKFLSLLSKTIHRTRSLLLSHCCWC